MTTNKLPKNTSALKICSANNCDKASKLTKGLCKKHYLQFWRTGSPETIRKNYCQVSDCEEKNFGKGLCQKHYCRKRAHGSPLISNHNFGTGKTFEQRFWSRVAITADTNRCWIWQGAGKPYGRVYFNGKYYGTHQIALYLSTGEMPNDETLHSCDNKICCNPKHLRDGTHQENMNDAKERHRTASGVRNGNAKLNDEKVKEIRLLLEQGKKIAAIAQQFDVSSCPIRDIALGKSWRHVK